MNKAFVTVGSLLVLVVLFVAVNVLSASTLKSARLDLTENKLFTLSDGTINILESLEEPITLRFFYSRDLATDLPEYKDYAKRIQELLEEYVAHAKGMVELEVLEPEPYSEAEELAAGFGLRGLPANTAGEVFFLGLAGTNSTDDEERIPFFDQRREVFLEYDLTKLVYKLSDPKKPVVGVLSSLPLFGPPANPMDPRQPPPQPWFIIEQMQQMFEVEQLSSSPKSFDDIDLLMIVHPMDLPEETLFAIDQFVLGGGKVLAFVDPFSDVQEVPQNPQNPMAGLSVNRTSSLGPLLESWGVAMDDFKVVGDAKNCHRVNFRGRPTDYIVWLNLRKDNFSQDDFTTAELGQLNIPSAGAIRKIEGASTQVDNLVTTSTESMLVDRTAIAVMPDPPKLLDEFYSDDTSYAVAVRISGPAKTAYPDGPPETLDEEEGDEAAEEASDEGAEDWLKESQGPINVVLVSDADMLENRWWVRLSTLFNMRVAQPSANNGDFVINTLENLSGSNDLISLRSRGRYNRPFEKKDELRRKADERFREKANELEQRLTEIQQEITALEGQRDDASSRAIFTPEQLEQIAKAREEERQTNKELREVRHKLRQDIESLGRKLKLANIFGIPLLVCLVPIAMWFVRSSRKNKKES